MYVAIGLGDSAQLRRSKYFAEVIRIVLYALVAADRAYLKTHPSCPLLYDSGVVYKNETPAHITTFERQNKTRIERFDDIPTCMQRGWADCDDIAPWRVSELRERFGEEATLRVTWKKFKGRKVFHIQVRRADGTIEDPCVHLGMPTDDAGDALPTT